jgi:hypothetical protein
MFAPEELCEQFWEFVRCRAFDENDEYTFSLVLLETDDDRRDRALYLQYGDSRVEPPGAFDDLTRGRARAPVIYETVQAALLDFLIDRIGNNRVPDFPDWLRAQALIMAQAGREPEWLTVRTPVVDEDGNWSPDNLTTHTMEIALGSWDALSWETYDVLVRRFYGSMHHYPLRNYTVKRLLGEIP